MLFEVPLFLPSVANLREHFMARARRNKEQRAAVYLAAKSAIAHGQKLPDPPCVVLLTRQSPRSLDEDNLASAFKAVQDQVAQMLGVNDRHSELVQYKRNQRRGPPKVVVAIHSRGELFDTLVTE